MSSFKLRLESECGTGVPRSQGALGLSASPASRGGGAQHGPLGGRVGPAHPHQRAKARGALPVGRSRAHPAWAGLHFGLTSASHPLSEPLVPFSVKWRWQLPCGVSIRIKLSCMFHRMGSRGLGLRKCTLRFSSCEAPLWPPCGEDWQGPAWRGRGWGWGPCSGSAAV